MINAYKRYTKNRNEKDHFGDHGVDGKDKMNFKRTKFKDMDFIVLTQGSEILRKR